MYVTMHLSMMMILMYFIISHGGASVTLPDGSLAQLPQGPSWGTGLCCDLSAACPDATEGEDDVPPASGNGSQGVSRSNPCCGLDSPASGSETQGHGVVCLNILCWVDGDLEHLICNLKVRENPSNTSRRVPISMLHLASELHLGNGTDGGTQSNCEGGEVITCLISLHSSSSLVSLTVNISNGTNSVRSPVMRVDPKDFMRLDPPVNLQYNVTVEGVVRLSWTVPPHSLRLLCCDVRYSPKPSAPSWEHIRGLRTAEAALSDLGAGLNYTAQVRCRRPGQPSLKSVWSRPLYIYLHEVSYVPERLFANAGSNVTIYCIFNNRSLSASNVVWWLNYHQKVPESQYSVVNEYTSSVTLLNVKPPQQRGYDVLLCCQRQGEKSLCSYPYAQIYVKDIDMGISCETNGELASMTCRWNASQWAEVRFLYRRYDLPCDTLKGETGGASPAEECPVEGRGSRRCTLRPLLLASCYRMWLEVRKEEGAIQSRPVYVTPMELVKPHPPFDLDGVTVPDGFLSIRWKRHELPVYELQYELRYAAGKVDAQWKVHGSVFNLSAVVGVSEPCAVYTVQVRCKRLKGAGFWSDWSNPYNTTVHNFRAPESGPDFWRVIKENPKSNQTNVTLLLKPLPREKLFCCVEGLVIHHQTSGGAKWTEKFDYGSSYTFPWTEDVHRVTVLAINSIGYSTRNSNMTLNRLFKSPSIQSFSSTVINSSCVALSWTLIANSSSPVSFVIEWKSQSRGGGPEDDGERVEWVRVPPMDRVFYLHDTFFASEEYQFILYPIFLNGEGEPVYSKDDRGRSRDEHAAYVLLMIVAFLSVVLFVSLTISQDQMRKVVWKDVPNPNNCSWARGVDFKKAETIENLFQHHERQTSCPLLLELEIISEAVVMEKTGPLGPDKEREAATLSPHSDSEKILEVEAPTFLISPDCSDQSGIIYATVLLPEEPDLHYKQQESLSNSSDEGNFSANISDISESFPGGLWELENPPGFEPDPHRFCFYNSAEEFSETSELEDEGQDRAGTGKDLYYLGVASREEDEKEEVEVRIRKEGVPEPACMERGLLPLESNPLLRCLDSQFSRTDAEARGTPLYMPQFRTASSEPHRTRAHESRLQSSPL